MQQPRDTIGLIFGAPSAVPTSVPASPQTCRTMTCASGRQDLEPHSARAWCSLPSFTFCASVSPRNSAVSGSFPVLEPDLEALKRSIVLQSLDEAMHRSPKIGPTLPAPVSRSQREDTATKASPILGATMGAGKTKETGQSGEPTVGLYTLTERLRRILSYKQKLKTWREAHPVSRVFCGRKKVALNKPRVNGKFARGSNSLH